MKLDKLIKSILRTAIYIMDETAEQVDRVSHRASAIANDTSSAIHPERDRTLRNVVSFAAGMGVGVGAAMLLAPSSGAQLRGSIGDKVHDIGNRVRGQREGYATGTEIR